jgi:predicted ATPase
LQECPRLTVLTTSREVLNIAGEIAYRVPSLDVPDLEMISSFDDLSQVESVRLFAERAAAVMPSFRLSPKTLPAVAHLCHRLDGIPLAIELAAARVIVLSVDEIAAHLDDCFSLLTGGSRAALPRQRTLRASIDWSYNLLSQKERLLLQRLSVFSGGWSLPAAGAVCTGKGLEAREILDALTGLVAKSLVIADHPTGAETRYRMLETIHQYARECLVDAGEETTSRDRHLAYFLSLAEEFGPLLRTPKIYELLERLDLELDNFRAALTHALNKKDRGGSEQTLRADIRNRGLDAKSNPPLA